MARKTHLVVLPAALFGVLAAFGSARAAYPVCPGKTFTIHAAAAGGALPAGSALVVADGQATLGACPATRARLRGTKKGTRITARWTSCPGVGRMRLKGMVDPMTCGTFKGDLTVAAPHTKTPVVATAKKGDAPDAVRIGTYNVQFLPGEFGRYGSPCAIGNGDNDDFDRPPVIAERVKASGYDIIAFNEVFDNTAQERMVEAMKDTYPYYIQHLDPDVVNQQDSGLQIFSRWPFAKIDALPPFYVDTDSCLGSNPNDWVPDCGRTVIQNFDACDDDDCLAAKGAALVRIENPDTHQMYNVVFTHTQASYDGDDSDQAKEHFETRRLQLLDIKELIETGLTPEERDREEVIVMGDLNIDGDQTDPDLGPDYMFLQNLYEWNQRLNNPGFAGGFFFDYLPDSWDLQNLPLAVADKDRGITNDKAAWTYDQDPGARLDYVLRHPQPYGDGATLCAQHMYRSYNLRANAPFTESAIGEPGTEGGSCDLSDHIALTLDLNLSAPHCSPQTATIAGVPAGAGGQILPGSIEHAAGMQWFRFDQPGTYAFALDSDGDDQEDDDLHFQLYVSTDLSTPLHGYKDKTVDATVWTVAGYPVTQTLKKFVIPKAPFYVKVLDPERTFTGPYNLTAWRADCSSKEQACVLLANQLEEHAFPANQPLNADDTAWFEMTSEKTDGAPQQLGFRAYHYSSPLLAVELRAADGTTVLGNAVPKIEPLDGTWTAEIAQSTADANGYYMLVKRNNAGFFPVSYRALWHTNLTMLVDQTGAPGAVPITLDVAIKTDDIGSDEIYLTVYADGKVIVPEKYFANLANNEFAGLDWLPFPIKFVDTLKFVFREDDDNQDELLEVLIPSLQDWTRTCAVNLKDKAVKTQGANTTHAYFLQYNLCHGLMQP